MKKRATTRIIRPFLSTTETMSIADADRGTLRHYVSKGVIDPEGRTDGDYNRWSFEQAIALRLIRDMRSNGASLDEIASHRDGGLEELLDAAYESSVESIRRNRRALKSIVHYRRQMKRFAPVGRREGYYLRYLPERWMAVLPFAENANGLIDMDDFVDGYLRLKGVLAVVGWSQTFSTGTLTSFDSHMGSSTTYVFQELASPPMPVVTGSRIVDGGCYRALDPSGSAECAGGPCEECSRFGRSPNSKELFTWKTLEATGKAVERTVLSNSLEVPYATGMWAGDSRQAAAEGRIIGPPSAEMADDPAARDKGTGGGPISGPEGDKLPTVLPRIMPQNTRLPLSATACVLPAGMYLCSQNDFEERDTALQQMLFKLNTLPSRRIEEADELTMSEQLHEQRELWDAEKKGKRRKGPFVEPFAAPRDFGDPKLFGFVRDVPDGDLEQITLLENAALAPEDGFVIAHTDIPCSPASAESFTQELQVLVDPAEFLRE